MEGDINDGHNVFKDGEDAVDSRFTIVDMPPVAEYTNQRKGELQLNSELWAKNGTPSLTKILDKSYI